MMLAVVPVVLVIRSVIAVVVIVALTPAGPGCGLAESRFAIRHVVMTTMCVLTGAPAIVLRRGAFAGRFVRLEPLMVEVVSPSGRGFT